MKILKIGKYWFLENDELGFVRENSTQSNIQWTKDFAKAKSFDTAGEAQKFGEIKIFIL